MVSILNPVGDEIAKVDEVIFDKYLMEGYGWITLNPGTPEEKRVVINLIIYDDQNEKNSRFMTFDSVKPHTPGLAPGRLCEKPVFIATVRCI